MRRCIQPGAAGPTIGLPFWAWADHSADAIDRNPRRRHSSIGDQDIEQWTPHQKRPARTRVVALADLRRGFAAMAAATALGGGASPTKGRIPDEAITANGGLDIKLVPDYIVALDREGNPVGYVKRDDALGLSPQPTDEQGRPGDALITVYGEDLVSVVGEMVPGRGFVPAGTDSKLVPTFDIKSGPAEPISP